VLARLENIKAHSPSLSTFSNYFNFDAIASKL